RGLPLFLSVWVDALVKARLLTPFQAAEINAGRGEKLRVGPYVLHNRLGSLGYAETFLARHIESGEIRRLAVRRYHEAPASSIRDGLEQLVVASRELPCDVLAPVEDWGDEGTQVWAACGQHHGRTAAEAMIFHGRFPPEMVLEIARAMMTGLVALEQAGLCHGDLRAATLTLGSTRNDARIGPRLPFPGLRAVLRPREGYAHLDLPPEAFDGLAPERIRDATPANTASDVYACGCLWWHLLTGRDPLPGGDGLTKLQTAQRAEVVDPRPLAPEVPKELLAVIRACTRPLSNDRPAGMVELASMLGPTTPRGQGRLRLAVRDVAGPMPLRHGVGVRPGFARWKKLCLGAAAACAVAIAVLLPVFRPSDDLREARPCEPLATAPAESASIAMAAEMLIATPLPLLESGPITESSPPLSDDNSKVIHASAITATNQPRSTPAPGCDESRGTPALGCEKSPTTPQRDGHETALADWSDAREPVARVSLRPGQRVRDPSGKRIRLRVASQGLLVDTPDVVFENIDFVLDGSSLASDRRPPAAILVLHSPGVTLRGCTFHATRPGVDAIRWMHPTDENAAATSLPSGAISVERCVFAGVEAAIDCRAHGALALRFSNVLHVGDGPLVCLRRLHGPDEPMVLALDRTTLRGSGPVVRFDAVSQGAAGSVRIEANDCVFALKAGEPLLSFADDALSSGLLKQIAWSGQGSLVTPENPIAGRQGELTQVTLMADDSIAIDGLVRSKVEFAGQTVERPADSVVVGWLAPLRSNQAPGIDPSAFDE
ncbi:MAG TPA: hypothetical protein DD670_01880, partial [Planctomycetaceae bacterium]|nr:hypothetical protein [Planctomycetaceae bacterium]